MKTITTYLYIILLIAAISSCKKDSAGGSASTKVVSYTEEITAVGSGRVVESYDVNYDAQDRITSVQSTTRPGHRMVYQYSSENSFTYDKIEDNKIKVHHIYFVNNLSLIDSTWHYENKSDPNYTNDTLSERFFYNEDKKLVKQKQYLNSYLLPPVLYNTVNYQYDLKGTLTKELDGEGETSYSYETDQENTVQLEPFYFPYNKQLPSHTYTMRHGTTTQVIHGYAFDDHKRVKTDTATSNDGRVTIITIRNYTYER
ncbi:MULTISPECIES: hypothetical protein [Niastella]|uniref:DUF4595 domain-containing protein n=1 Tax=Niastella soli TaxID=2821487 RepID=A0ABS3Z193_9BACT|nr:hypothetical protein [Niastella soli]MBO9203941.1 hypothetical protein [Niastella soli]